MTGPKQRDRQAISPRAPGGASVRWPRVRWKLARWELARWPLTLALVAAALAWGRACPAQDVSAWEYSPYQVRIWIALDDAPSLAGMERPLARRLIERADVTFGAAWKVEAGPAPARARFDLTRRLSAMSVEVVEAYDSKALVAATGEDLDKLIVVSIAESPDGYLVQSRELDARARSFGRLESQLEGNRARLAAAASEVLVRAFTPITRIERTRGNTAYVRVRAAGLVDTAQSPVAIGPGAMLRPVFRRNDRRGRPVPGGLFAPPWTYLLPQGKERTLLECRILAGVRTPLSGRVSRRIERFALAAYARTNSTRLVLEAVETPGRPLVGYELYAKNVFDPPPSESSASPSQPPPGSAPPGEAAPPASPGAGPPASPTVGATEEDDQGLRLEFLGLTDWQGAIEIPVGGDSPVRILYVKNGNVPLARLPCAPGVEPQMTMSLKSDDLRLEAEGIVRGVQSSLMDVVCQRAVHAARIRKKIKDAKYDEAQALLDELRNMPGRDSFQVRLTQQKSRFRTSDSRMKAKIDDLFNVTKELVDKYLDSEEPNRLAAELRAAREGRAPAAASPAETAPATAAPAKTASS